MHVCCVCVWCVWLCVCVCVCVCVCAVCVCGVRVWCACVVCVVFVHVCVCVCAEVIEVYDTMSCLPIVSDRAATEGSKYFELGRQPHEFLTRNTCLKFAHILLNML